MQGENGDVLFGTSVLGGFNRRNVLNYIGQLQNRLSEANAVSGEQLRAAQEELRTLQKQVQSLTDALSRANDDKQALEISYIRVQKENDALRGQLDEAREEAKKLRGTRAASLRRSK